MHQTVTMRWLVIGVAALGLAACRPAADPPPTLSCTAHVEASGGLIHFWADSNIPQGTAVTVQASKNGVEIGAITTLIGYQGSVDLTVPQPTVTSPVIWSGRVLHDGSVLCSADLTLG